MYIRNPPPNLAQKREVSSNDMEASEGARPRLVARETRPVMRYSRPHSRQRAETIQNVNENGTRAVLRASRRSSDRTPQLYPLFGVGKGRV